MNSKIIFDHVRNKLGSTQKQYDALLRLLNNGASVEDISIFVGLSTEVVQDEALQPSTSESTKLSERDIKRLEGVDGTLVQVVKRASEISSYSFMVVEGMRTLETQKKYVAQGKSQTLKSRHLIGQAVDLAPVEAGTIDWNNSKGQFDAVAEAMKQAAKELGVKITWGGDWKFVDKPHFQIEKWEVELMSID